MTDPKPIPQVPAALCGLFPGAHADLAGNRYQATEEFESGVWQFKYRTNHGVQYITMSCHDMALLLDSPLALCHAARWLAGRLGLDPGVTAPEWRYNGSHWYLMCVGGKVAYFYDYENGPTKQTEYSWWLRVPGVNNMSPAEALAAACAAVGGAS